MYETNAYELLHPSEIEFSAVRDNSRTIQLCDERDRDNMVDGPDDGECRLHVRDCRHTQASRMGHRNYGCNLAFAAYFWDDANSNGVREVEECSTRQSFLIKGHENVVTNTLTLGAFDRDNDGMLDHWELLHEDAGLSPTNAADAFVDFDSDGLINLHEYWAKCNPAVPDGSNTVLSIMARSIDSLLTTNTVGRIDKFSVYNATFNTNCWAYPIDTTCASANNSCQQYLRAGTAISSRHVALANHFIIPNGCTIDFISTNGNLITRRVVAGKRVLQTDIYIALLEEALPEIIKPAYILPPNYQAYIRSGIGLPLLMFDYSEHAIVTDLAALPTSKGSVDGRKPRQYLRRLYYEEVVSGDSGDPKFLVVNHEVILVSTLHSFGSDNSGVGPFYQVYADDVQRVMNELSDRNSKPRDVIRFFDFSDFMMLGE